MRLTAGTDKRSRLVSLTDSGRQRLEDAKPAWRAAQHAFETAFGEAAAALRATMGRLARTEFSLPAGENTASAAGDRP